MPKATAAKKKSKRPTAEKPVKSTSEPAAKKTKPKVEAVDESTWPESTISPGQKVNKTKAKELYRLKDEELAGVSFERVEIVKTIKGQRITKPMILYRERDVERRAWRKHGSRDAFYNSLDKLKARYAKAQAKLEAQPKPFHAPDQYLNNRGLQAHGIAAALLRRTLTPDEEWTSTRELLGLKARFTPWVWNAVVSFLGEREFFYWQATREQIVKIALKQLQYPERPQERLPPSVSLDKLRVILARAPASRDKRDYEQSPGITWVDDHENTPSPQWSDDYTSELYSALIDVVHEHGLGDKGWKTVRWEVYDKHASCIRGIELSGSGRSLGWFDDALRWLRGKPADGEHPTPMRTKFKALLPKTDHYGCNL